NERIRGLGAMLLFEHAVGEHDAMTLLDSLDVEPLPDEPAEEGLQPFAELAAVFDEVKEQKYPPPGALPLDSEGEWSALRGTIEDARALVLLNTGLVGLAGHPAYDRRLVVSIAFNQVRDDGMPGTEAEHVAVQDLGERLAEALGQDQESL